MKSFLYPLISFVAADVNLQLQLIPPPVSNLRKMENISFHLGVREDLLCGFDGGFLEFQDDPRRAQVLIF